jgi:RNA recognition motif-containing protein
MALIYVGNIDHRNTEASVRAVFEVYGPVATVNLRLGFAVVEMSDERQAQNAMSDLNTQSSWVVRALAA